MLKIVYNSKLVQNNFENFFLIDTSNFELNFSHFSNVSPSPKLYYIENENASKNMIEPLSKKTTGMFTNTKWEKTQGIRIKDMIRLEW
jgi:hypothetical protein